MIVEICCILVIPLICLILYDYIKHLYILKDFPHGPFPLPVIGNLHLFSSKPYKDLSHLASAYGEIYSISFGMTRCVIVNSIDATNEALITKGYQFAGRPTNIYTIKLFSRDNKDFGFSDYSPLWKMKRKLVHSLLKVYGTNMEKYENWIAHEIDALQESLLESGEQEIDPEYEIGCLVLNIICRLTFGKRYQRNDDEFKVLIKSQKLIVEGLGASDAVAFLPWLRIFPLKGLANLKKGILFRDVFLNKNVKEHQERFDQQNIADFTDQLIKVSQENSALGAHLQDNDFLEMFVYDIFAAGNETTTTTILWFLLFMLHWPHYQEEIYKEIIKVSEKNQYPTNRDQKNFPFLQACIHETLRLGNVVILGLPRKTTEKTSLRNQRIPKDAQVIFNFWNLHMNPKYWDRPSEFNPYRWLDNNDHHFEPGKYPYFLPFSAGVRNCPGEVFAKLELFLIVSRLIKDFRIVSDTVPSLEGVLGVTLSPKPFKVKFVPRNT